MLTITALCINFFIYHYPGNNYFPPDTFLVALFLILFYCGFSVNFGRVSLPARISKEIIFFYAVMILLTWATNAAQYTPFPTIDKKILAIEKSLHININSIMIWVRTQPKFLALLSFLYDTLPLQMTYIPLFLIIIGRFQSIREYYFLLLVSTIMGFSFYYFFPTTAPASVITAYNFSVEQQATGLKFIQIHHYLQPTTLDGGMIALPSFHVIWAWFCLYLLRGWSVLFLIMLPVNLLIVVSCVLLGWHYCLDILGAIVVVVLSHGLLVMAKRRSVVVKLAIFLSKKARYDQHIPGSFHI